MSLPQVVIGDGWAALLAIGFIVARNEPVVWLPGNHLRLFAPIDGLMWAQGPQSVDLHTQFSLPAGIHHPAELLIGLLDRLGLELTPEESLKFVDAGSDAKRAQEAGFKAPNGDESPESGGKRGEFSLEASQARLDESSESSESLESSESSESFSDESLESVCLEDRLARDLADEQRLAKTFGSVESPADSSISLVESSLQSSLLQAESSESSESVSSDDSESEEAPVDKFQAVSLSEDAGKTSLKAKKVNRSKKGSQRARGSTGEPNPTLQTQGLMKQQVSLPGLDAGKKTGFIFEMALLLRDYRAKAFRHPIWKQNPAQERALWQEILTVQERQFVPPTIGRFTGGVSLVHLFAKLQDHVLKSGLVDRIENTALKSLVASSAQGDSPIVVGLTSGQKIQASRCIYADSWLELGLIEGMPKPLPEQFTWELSGVLQLRFDHQKGLALDQKGITYFTELQKQPHQVGDRRLWGYFLDDFRHSIWTVLLTPQEALMNQEIAKKIRRMQTALGKMFDETEAFVPFKGFMNTVTASQVVFEPSGFFDVNPVLQIPSPWERVVFLTDGFGPDYAIMQAHHAFFDDGALSVDVGLFP
jgi:hypothetical protein